MAFNFNTEYEYPISEKLYEIIQNANPENHWLEEIKKKLKKDQKNGLNYYAFTISIHMLNVLFLTYMAPDRETREPAENLLIELVKYLESLSNHIPELTVEQINQFNLHNATDIIFNYLKNIDYVYEKGISFNRLTQRYNFSSNMRTNAFKAALVFTLTCGIAVSGLATANALLENTIKLAILAMPATKGLSIVIGAIALVLIFAFMLAAYYYKSSNQKLIASLRKSEKESQPTFATINGINYSINQLDDLYQNKSHTQKVTTIDDMKDGSNRQICALTEVDIEYELPFKCQLDRAFASVNSLTNKYTPEQIQKEIAFNHEPTSSCDYVNIIRNDPDIRNDADKSKMGYQMFKSSTFVSKTKETKETKETKIIHSAPKKLGGKSFFSQFKEWGRGLFSSANSQNALNTNKAPGYEVKKPEVSKETQKLRDTWTKRFNQDLTETASTTVKTSVSQK